MAGNTQDPRPRNSLGMYATGADVTPEDMNRAYGTRRVVWGPALAKVRAKSQAVPPPSTQGLAARVRRLCELAKFDLAERAPDYGCCASPAPAGKTVKRYPRLNLYDMPAEVPLPASGKAVVEYKVRSRESREDSDGNERFGMGIEIRSIEPVKPDEKKDGAKTIDVDFAERRARLCELAFGDRILGQAGAGVSTLLLRTRMANALRLGRQVSRKVYPRASQRAVNWAARGWKNRSDLLLNGSTTPNPAQASRIEDAWRRRQPPGMFAASARDANTVVFERQDLGAAWQQEGGWLKLKRADGTEARVPLKGFGNRFRRHPVATSAASAAVTGAVLTGAGAAGAALAPRLKALVQKFRK